MWHHVDKLFQKISTAIVSVPFMLFQKQLKIQISHAYLWHGKNGTFMLCMCQFYANVHKDKSVPYIILHIKVKSWTERGKKTLENQLWRIQKETGTKQK